MTPAPRLGAAAAAMRMAQAALRRTGVRGPAATRRGVGLTWRRPVARPAAGATPPLGARSAAAAPPTPAGRLEVLHRFELSLRWSISTRRARSAIGERALRFTERERRAAPALKAGLAAAPAAALTWRRAADALVGAQPRVSTLVRRAEARPPAPRAGAVVPDRPTPAPRGAPRLELRAERAHAAARIEAARADVRGRAALSRRALPSASPLLRPDAATVLPVSTRPRHAAPAPQATSGRPRRPAVMSWAPPAATPAKTTVAERPRRAGAPAALAWRTAESAGSDPTQPRRTVSSPAFPSAPPATELRAAAPQRLAAEPLSRPAVDRLADDVMSRIERKLRIERERRGL